MVFFPEVPFQLCLKLESFLVVTVSAQLLYLSVPQWPIKCFVPATHVGLLADEICIHGVYMWSTSITHHSPWLCTIPHDSAISGPKSTCARHACNAEGMAHGVHKIEAPCTFNMVPDAIQWIFLVVALVPSTASECGHLLSFSKTQQYTM